MGGFFEAPPNPDQPVPPGPDAFDVPAANWRLIGQMFAKGQQDAAATAAGTPGLSDLFSHPIDTLLTWIAYLLAWILSKLLCIVAFLLRMITAVDDRALPGMDAVATASLAHVFNLPVGGAGGRKVARSVDGKAVGDALGQQIIAALAGGTGQSPGTPISPSDVPTAHFLAELSRIGIEGWIDGALGEAVSLGRFKSILELVPIMADILGLGRLSRRVLAPPLKIMVEDPYTWKLNMDFRPTLLAHDQAVRQFLRGRMDRGALDTELGRQGFSSSAIEALININTKQLPIADVDYLLSHAVYAQGTAEQTLKNDGWDPLSASTLLEIARQRRLDAWHKLIADESIAAFVRGDLDEAGLHTNVTASNLPQEEQALLELVALSKRSLTLKHLTLGEVETLVKAHIMSLDDLRAWMTRENYPLDEQTLLELWLFGKITAADQAAQAKKDKATAAAAAKAAKLAAQQAKAAAAAAKLQAKGVSLATFEKLVEDGQRTFAEFAAFLAAQGFAPAAITDLVDYLHTTIAKKQTLQQQHDALAAEADAKHIPLSQTEKAVLAGVLGIPDLIKFMTDNEYAAADIAIAQSSVQQQLDAAKAKAMAKHGATTAAATKGISLPELERAARLGIITPAHYAAALDAAGFTPEDRDIMVGILNDQITADAATLAKRKAANTAATKKRISLVKLENAVIAGTRPIADYQSELSLLGYDSTDQQSLVELLELRVDHAKDVAAKKAAAADKLKARGVSLADLEAAVKLGVTSIEEYTAQLAQDGFSPADQELLATSLLAEIAAARAKKPIATLPTAPAPAPPA